jgi:hypothetical protein
MGYRGLNEKLIFQGSIEGNWINRWNWLRSEGGTVWASQNGFEGHARQSLKIRATSAGYA